MERSETVSGKVVPVAAEDVDTDQIIPAQFLRLLTKKGLGRYLFYRWRYDENGKLKAGFVLDDEKFRGANILVAGRNFGIGSSREHAVWALLDHGIECVIAPSFGDIFYNNAAKNYLVCVRLAAQDVAALQKEAVNGTLTAKVDLRRREVTSGNGFQARFAMEDYVLHKLTERKDDIDVMKEWEGRISEYERTKKSFLNNHAGNLFFEDSSAA